MPTATISSPPQPATIHVQGSFFFGGATGGGGATGDRGAPHSPQNMSPWGSSAPHLVHFTVLSFDGSANGWTVETLAVSANRSRAGEGMRSCPRLVYWVYLMIPQVEAEFNTESASEMRQNRIDTSQEVAYNMESDQGSWHTIHSVVGLYQSHS